MMLARALILPAYRLAAMPGPALSRAQELLAPYLNGVAGSFIDNTLMSKDTITPANAYVGAPFDKLVFTRAGPGLGTRINPAGLIETVAAHTPRIDHDPVTLENKGLLVEQVSTNMLLNATVDGASLVTQGVTVTAVAHTISFYGAGRVTLSGAHAAVVDGLGPFPSRKTYTFTPTAGTLTVTVAGSVNYAQLETGTFETSFIPTAAAAVARNNDQCKASGFFPTSGSQGTMYVEVDYTKDFSVMGFLASCNDGTNTNKVGLRYSAGAAASVLLIAAGTTDANLPLVTATTGRARMSASWQFNDVAGSYRGSPAMVDSQSATPLVTQVSLGTDRSTLPLNGHVREFMYLPARIPNAAIEALST